MCWLGSYEFLKFIVKIKGMNPEPYELQISASVCWLLFVCLFMIFFFTIIMSSEKSINRFLCDFFILRKLLPTPKSVEDSPIF